MLVMLAYDLPSVKHQTLLRKAFESVGGVRVQFSIYIFEGEDHECERVIRYMRRIATPIQNGDIRLITMERSIWDQQIVVLGEDAIPKSSPLARFVIIWE